MTSPHFRRAARGRAAFSPQNENDPVRRVHDRIHQKLHAHMRAEIAETRQLVADIKALRYNSEKVEGTARPVRLKYIIPRFLQMAALRAKLHQRSSMTELTNELIGKVDRVNIRFAFKFASDLIESEPEQRKMLRNICESHEALEYIANPRSIEGKKFVTNLQPYLETVPAHEFAIAFRQIYFRLQQHSRDA